MHWDAKFYQLTEIIIRYLITFLELVTKKYSCNLFNIKNICVIKVSLKLLLRKVRIRPLSLRVNAAHDDVSL